MVKTKPTTYKTLKGLMKALGSRTVTGQTMADKQAVFADGRVYNFKVSESLENEFWTNIAKVIWKRPTERQVYMLKYAKSFALRRMIFDNDRYCYVAGQDYPSEIRTIQNYVNKM